MRSHHSPRYSRLVEILAGPHVGGRLWRCLYFFIMGPSLGALDLSAYVSPLARIGRRRELRIGAAARINAFCNLAGDISIGSGCEINSFTSIYGKVVIGKDVLIAPGTMIAGGNHLFADRTVSIKAQGNSEIGIVIEDNVWIGANACILDGTRIGAGCVVAAGSVIKGAFPAHSIISGSRTNLSVTPIVDR